MSISSNLTTRLIDSLADPTAGAEMAALLNAVVASGTLPSNAGAVTIGTNATDSIAMVGVVNEQTSAGLTAHAGGGQGSALALTGQINQISTVATAGDSVALPLAVHGRYVTVINDGANSMQVFGAGTDTINSVATATGVPQPAGTSVTYRCVSSAPAGNWRFNPPSLPANLDNTVSTGTGTMVSGAMEGASVVTLTASGQAAITLTTRTAAQIQANVPNWYVGQTYRLRIINNNTGTLTTAGGSNVTMTSTIPAGYFADYTVTFATSGTITVAQVTTAPVKSDNAVAGVASGYKIARGVHQQAAASDTIVSGLATVVSVVVQFRDTPTAKQSFVTASIGDQAGTPAAGSFLQKTFKSTYAAADDFTDNISFDWIAVGT